MGAAFGVSQLVGGAYDELTWSTIALGLLGVALALAVGSPARRPPLALLAPALGLWLWSLISSGWSESVDASRTAADRWLLYAAMLAILWWILDHDRRRAAVLLSGACAGVLGVSVWMLARMLGGHGPELFLGTRLNDPLGYVNGQAAYLLAGVWPALALAERQGSKAAAALAGLGASTMVALTGLGLMAQSRSWGIGLAVTAAVTLAFIPGRRRRGAVLIVVVGAVAVIFVPLARVWGHPSPLTGVVTVQATRHAALLIVLAAVAAGLVWAIAVFALDFLARPGSRRRSVAGSLTGAALAALGLAAAVAIAANGGRISHQVQSQYRAFTHQAPSPSGTRLFSGAGNRYDYWRVAWREFRSAPVKGVGAGDYDPGWYLHRDTNESITQPHSIELQTLAELGLVGAALLAAYLLAVVVGFGHTVRAARRDPPARFIAVAAGGVFTGWWIQTSVDWIHLIPGVTAIALAAAVALVSRPELRDMSRLGLPRLGRGVFSDRARLVTIVLATAVVIAGVVTIAPRVISLRAEHAAQHALDHGHARAAIRHATTALQYDSRFVDALVLRSAGFARLHDFAAARANLKLALRAEPRNWVTWALLGDLLTRRGDRSGARAAYARAHALNPLEPFAHGVPTG